MRKTIIVVVLAVVVAGVVGLGVASSTLRRQVGGRAEAIDQAIRERTGLVIVSPSVSVELFPPAAVLRGGKLHEKGSGNTFVAEGGTIRLVGRLGDLLEGRFAPERVVLDGVRLLVRPETSDSAFGLLSALRDVKVPVELADCVLEINRGQSLPPFEATKINLRLTPGAVVPFDGTAALLGPSSHGQIQGEWRPGAGRTGGDGLKLHLDVRDGDPDAIGRLVPGVQVAPMRGGTHVDITAEGFIGERSTEALPAEPLKGHARAESDFELFGLRRPAVFETGFTLDDRRWVLDNGQGRWGERPFTYAGWIAREFSANKVNLRMGLKNVVVADVLADYGIPERWRPQATVNGEIRLGNSLAEPLARYDVKADGVHFDGWPGVPVSSTRVDVTGSLLAINAEAAGSFTTDQLKLANLVFDHILIGASWWRGKLNVTTLKHAIWDGKLDAAASYSPAESPDASGGGLLHNVEAKSALAALFPDLDTGVDGRLNVSVQGGYAVQGQGLWYDGRFELRNGSVAKGVLRTLADRVVSVAGGSPAAIDALAAQHPALSSSRTGIEYLSGAFLARQTPRTFEVNKVVSDEVSLRGTGTIDEGKRIDADGVATFAVSLVRALAQQAPAIAKLAAADGSVAIPFHAKGPVNDFAVELDPSFASALEKARSGAPAAPFVAPAAPELLNIDIPQLYEQFGEGE